MTSFERVEHFCAHAPFEEVMAFLYNVLNRSYRQIVRDLSVDRYRPEMDIWIDSLDSLLAAREVLRGMKDGRGHGHFVDAVRSADKFWEQRYLTSEAENVAYRALRIARKTGVGSVEEEREREEKELSQQLRWISRRRDAHFTKETLAAVDAYIADGLLIEDE